MEPPVGSVGLPQRSFPVMAGGENWHKSLLDLNALGSGQVETTYFHSFVCDSLSPVYQYTKAQYTMNTAEGYECSRPKM